MKRWHPTELVTVIFHFYFFFSSGISPNLTSIDMSAAPMPRIIFYITKSKTMGSTGSPWVLMAVKLQHWRSSTMHHGRERSAHSGGAHSSMIPLPLRVCSHPLSSLGPQFQQMILSHGKRPCHLQLMGSSWRMGPTSELLGPGSTRRIIHKFGRIWTGC